MHTPSLTRPWAVDKTCLSKYMERITSCWTVLCVLLVLTVTQCSPAQKALHEPVQCLCLQYGEDAKLCVNGTETCPPPTAEDKRVHCYAAWKNVSGKINVESMGCWLDHYECYDRHTCEETDAHDNESDVYFCCCEGSFCNRNHKYKPEESTSTSSPVDATPDTVPVPPSPLLSTILYSIVPILGIFIIVVATFYMWRKHKMAYHLTVPSHEPLAISAETGQDAPLLDELRPLQLQKLIARGRYACVWKAQMLSEVVAVKVFPVQDRNSFHTENEIYRLPLINQNSDILRYIGAERRGENYTMELWLITEFHEHGSLYDYLKGHPISWRELLHIAEGLVKGLAFLHEAIPSKKPGCYKPAIAHRDFKSKNVLLKADLSACVADFGLAMKFDPGSVIGDDHGQVGTRRYMAPEVLEGAINFNRDAFLRIDMYACGLVLWELLSRCTTDGGLTDEYHMPFEEEAGMHPTLEDMQEVVITKKLRPIIRETWLKNETLAPLCNTIEECWDQDPEARLSSGCVEERIGQLAQYTTSSPNNSSTTNPTSVTATTLSKLPETLSTLPTMQRQTLSPTSHITMDTSLSTTATTIETSSSGIEDSGGSAGSSTSSAATIPYLRTAGGETNAVYSPPNQLSSTRI